VVSKLARIAVRVLIAATIIWAVVSIPLPVNDAQMLLLIRVPIAVFVFVVYTGKTIYDTFFYSRQP
jgi:hypothetical protein